MITLALTPQKGEPVYNPIILVGTSSRQNLDNYLMIGEIFVDGNKIQTLRVAENPDNQFLFDIHKHVERELGSDFNPNMIGWNRATQSSATYSVSFGEEWRPQWNFFDNFFLPGSTLGFIGTQSSFPDGFATGSQIIVEQTTPFTFSQYNGLATITGIIATSSPAPGYPGNHWIISTNKTWLGNTPPNGGTISLAQFEKAVELGLTSFGGSQSYTWNGVNTFLEEISYDFRDYDLGNTTLGGITASFLTDAPDGWVVGTNSRMWLMTFNDNQADFSRHLYVQTNRGTFRMLNGNNTPSYTNKQPFLLVGCGTYHLGLTSSFTIVSGSFPIFDSSTTEYTIWVVGLSGNEISKRKTFKIDHKCAQYSNVQLIFRDNKGSYVPYNFKLKKREYVQMARTSWGQHYGRYAPSSNSWTYRTWDRGQTDLDVQISERFTLTTDWMSDANSLYMVKLLQSSEVYYIDEAGVTQAVNLTVAETERKRVVNDQLVNYVITFVLSQKSNSQRG